MPSPKFQKYLPITTGSFSSPVVFESIEKGNPAKTIFLARILVIILGTSTTFGFVVEEVEEEVAKSIKSYSAEQLKQIDINELKEYTKGVIHNEKIFQLLEDYSK